MTYKDLPDRNETLSDEIIQQVEIAIKYAGYIERQELEVEKFKTLEDKIIPDTFDFSTVPSLRLEARKSSQNPTGNHWPGRPHFRCFARRYQHSSGLVETLGGWEHLRAIAPKEIETGESDLEE